MKDIVERCGEKGKAYILEQDGRFRFFCIYTYTTLLFGYLGAGGRDMADQLFIYSISTKTERQGEVGVRFTNT